MRRTIGRLLPTPTIRPTRGTSTSTMASSTAATLSQIATMCDVSEPDSELVI